MANIFGMKEAIDNREGGWKLQRLPSVFKNFLNCGPLTA